MKNLVKRYGLNHWIEKFGIRNVKIVLIAITVGLAVLFAICLIMALIAHNQMNAYTTITM